MVSVVLFGCIFVCGCLLLFCFVSYYVLIAYLFYCLLVCYLCVVYFVCLWVGGFG